MTTKQHNKQVDGRLIRGKSKPEHFELNAAQVERIKAYGIAELAKDAGISRTILYRLLNDDVPECTIPTVRKIAATLGMTDWQFLKLK